MAVLLKKRLFNPGNKRMTARQKLFFGNKKQRAAAKRTLSVGNHRRSNSTKTRVKNVGEIITLSLPKYNNKRFVTEVIKNPMPVARRRANSGKRRKNAPRKWAGIYADAYGGKVARRRISYKRGAQGRAARAIFRSAGLTGTTRRANPGTKRRRRSTTRVVTKYRYRNPGLFRRYTKRVTRRRNPEWISADITKVAGILGGATVTNLIAKQLPAKYTTGTMGYATLAAIAFGQGYAVKKLVRNQALGQDMMIGGLVLVTMKLLSDLFPSISLPFSLSGPGLGLIGNSSFTVPQVPVAGSMGRFLVAPNYQTAINSAVPQQVIPAAQRGLHGINQSVTMGGRTGSRRVGRLN